MPRYFSDVLLRRLRNEVHWPVLLKRLRWPHKRRENQLAFLCPRCREYRSAVNPRTNLGRCFYCQTNFNQRSKRLRSALRELLPHLARKQEDDAITKMLDELRGQNVNEHFFPTPLPLVERMLQWVEIGEGKVVLEPSAGIGHIADAIRERYPDADLRTVEQDSRLVAILKAKGHDVHHGDFLEYAEQADVIVMNTPFARGLDIEHMRHAYGLLRPGGQLVSIMSAGPFFRDDAASRGFRDWFDSVRAEKEELPENSFRGFEAFREGGVRAWLMCVQSDTAEPHTLGE